MPETTRNLHGVKVKKMCASCLHRYVDKEGTRVCTKMQLKVGQTFCCHLWEMNFTLRRLTIDN